MKFLKFTAVFSLLACLGASSFQIYKIKHRSAEEVATVVRGTFPAANVQVLGFKLTVSAPGGQMSDIAKLIRELDEKPAMLKISLKSNEKDIGKKSGIGVSGSTGSGIRVGVHDSEGKENSNAVRSVTVLENEEGFIEKVRSVKGGGYKVRAHLTASGEVTLAVQYSSVAYVNPGVQNTSGIKTSLRGRLGEWIQMGAVTTSNEGKASGILSRQSQSDSGDAQVFFRVEKVN